MQMPLVLAGVVLFGWRALLTLIAVMGLVEIAEQYRKRVRLGPATLEGAEQARRVRVESLMLGLLLPPSLLAWHLGEGDQSYIAFPLIGCAVLLYVGFRLVAGILDRPTSLAVLATIITLHGAFSPLMTPNAILLPTQFGMGDINDVVAMPDLPEGVARPDLTQIRDSNHDAITIRSVASELSRISASSDTQQITRLIAFRLPELESVLIGTNPNFIGSASGLVLVIVAAWGVGYSRRVDFSSLVFCLMSAYAAAVIWEVMMRPHVEWPVRLTLVHYQLLSGTPLFVAIFFAGRIGQVTLVRQRMMAVLSGVLMPILSGGVGWHVGPVVAVLVGMSWARAKEPD